MNYSEYQAWFHIYNTAIGSMLRNEHIAGSLTVHKLASLADIAEVFADKALAKYSEVEKTTSTGEPAIDFQGLVDSVAKNVMKQQGKPNKR